MIGLIGVCVLLVLLSVGVPIGVAMGLVGLVGMCALLGIEPALIKSGVVLFESVSRYELGVLPLFLATGAGAEMRQSLGTAVFFGMIGVTIFGLLCTPVFYVICRALEGLMKGRAAVPPTAIPAVPGAE